MKNGLNIISYIISTVLFGLLTLLFLGVFVTSLEKNVIAMCSQAGLNLRYSGNYLGLFAGVIMYIIFVRVLIRLRGKHNLEWSMKFTHELTHTLTALFFWRKIHEFVVRGRECYVSYESGRVGYITISLAPYCIPIYTFMIFPFRFAGDSNYMMIFDAMIAFTYAYHIHTYIKQTHFEQTDILGCGIIRSILFISATHLAVASLILATPKGGVANALSRIFWEYPKQILFDPSGWFHEIINFF